MGRFVGFRYPQGLLVLDSVTGEVVLIPPVGGSLRVLRPAVNNPAVVSEEAEEQIPVRMAAAAAHEVVSNVAQVVATPATEEGRAAGKLPSPDGEGELPASSSPFDREVVATYPYPIAATYRSFLLEPEPRQRCKLLVNTFTGVLKMWAFQLASEYLLADGIKDAAVNETLVRDVQRPLISTWNLLIQRCLPVLHKEGITLFSPALAEAYENLESRCQRPFISQVRYEDAEGRLKFKESRLGMIQALIKYRNGLAAWLQPVS